MIIVPPLFTILLALATRSNQSVEPLLNVIAPVPKQALFSLVPKSVPALIVVPPLYVIESATLLMPICSVPLPLLVIARAPPVSLMMPLIVIVVVPVLIVLVATFKMMGKVIAWLFELLLVIFPANVMRLPPNVNAPAAAANVMLLKLISAVAILLVVLS